MYKPLPDVHTHSAEYGGTEIWSLM